MKVRGTTSQIFPNYQLKLVKRCKKKSSVNTDQLQWTPSPSPPHTPHSQKPAQLFKKRSGRGGNQQPRRESNNKIDRVENVLKRCEVGFMIDTSVENGCRPIYPHRSKWSSCKRKIEPAAHKNKSLQSPLTLKKSRHVRCHGDRSWSAGYDATGRR